MVGSSWGTQVNESDQVTPIAPKIFSENRFKNRREYFVYSRGFLDDLTENRQVTRRDKLKALIKRVYEK